MRNIHNGNTNTNMSVNLQPLIFSMDIAGSKLNKGGVKKQCQNIYLVTLDPVM